MSDARNRMNARMGNGNILPLSRTKRVRLVPNIRVENQDGYTYLMLGDDLPELASAMDPTNCRKLAEALIKHAEDNEKHSKRVIIPGGLDG